MRQVRSNMQKCLPLVQGFPHQRQLRRIECFKRLFEVANAPVYQFSRGTRCDGTKIIHLNQCRIQATGRGIKRAACPRCSSPNHADIELFGTQAVDISLVVHKAFSQSGVDNPGLASAFSYFFGAYKNPNASAPRRS